MKKFDDLTWAEGIYFVAYGARIGIRTNTPQILERLVKLLPPGWKYSTRAQLDAVYSVWVASNAIDQPHLLYAGSRRVVRSHDLDEVIDILESWLHLNVALHARRRLFVHAGVVAWRGEAIIIPGRSWSGKTSLVEALVREGATYYSDEYAVLDTSGRVHPYIRPLRVREGGDKRKLCPLEELGGSVGTKSSPVGLVVVTTYKRGAQWRPKPISPGEALLRLLDNTVVARTRTRFGLPILQRVVLGATAVKGNRGEAQDMVRSLLGCSGFLPDKRWTCSENVWRGRTRTSSFERKPGL
jgi:hypothetical protein